MTIVTLMDDTEYFVDTNEDYTARGVVSYKLDQRTDYRQIKDTKIMEDLEVNKNSKYYNSSDRNDGVPLQAKNSWSYKWGDRGTHFNRGGM